MSGLFGTLFWLCLVLYALAVAGQIYGHVFGKEKWTDEKIVLKGYIKCVITSFTCINPHIECSLMCTSEFASDGNGVYTRPFIYHINLSCIEPDMDICRVNGISN